MMKRCAYCKETLPTALFPNAESRFCLSCDWKLNYRKGPETIIAACYRGMESYCRNRGLPPLPFTMEQLRDRVLAGDEMRQHWRRYVSAKYDNDLRPSVVRADPGKPFSLGNIVVLTQREYRDRIRAGDAAPC